MTSTPNAGPSSPSLVLPYLRPRDYPECPVCHVRDDVLCGGQWLDGHCAWHCCHCEHDWTTEREPSWKGSSSTGDDSSEWTI